MSFELNWNLSGAWKFGRSQKMKVIIELESEIIFYF